MIENLIKQEFISAQTVLSNFLSDDKNFVLIEKAAEIMTDCIKNGGKIISCGNGGSHCDAMHFAEELTGRYRENRKALPAIAISDVSHISCVGNDFGYDYIFSRFIEALGGHNDTLLVISTSGNSQNVINAVNVAKKNGLKVVALTGKDGGKLNGIVDIQINVPYFGYADRIQEIHIKIIHSIILTIEKLIHIK
jgi:D-sedoheptulose 7-phosphate isomerase